MSIQAYQTTAQKTESPRQTEYRAFAQATRGLIDAAALPLTEIGRRGEALAKNKQLWSLLASDCAAEGNTLSQSLRAQIISLSIFVDRHTRAVMREGADFDVLIDINRTIMQGLSPVPAQQAMAARP
ncbi:MAG TPA: flagellar biosynthesis regulator FlaF [Hyphomonadaceae bacterium]|jgi:flagellar protein FlaF|nr:flagellar biosynthesis regulator FlaF [Hyphomonadaceae bacterium]